MSDAYQKFLQAKVAAAPSWGFDPPTGLCSDRLLPHQTAIVPWLIAGGRRALFAKFGLGKTVMQLEAVRICAEHENGRGLIVLPLGVRQEFQRDAVEILGWSSPPKFIRSIAEAGSTGVYLTNYETVRDGKLDPRDFIAVSLDEAAILRGFGGTLTFREMMATCAGDRKTLDSREITDGVKYRFVATAVPSPNDYIELLAYAAFLGIMEVSQAKTRWFKRNSEKADQLTIHPHKEAEFWQWVSTWALFITKPSDLGSEFSDDGYDVPPLEVLWHELYSDHSDAGTERDGQGLLFRNVAIGVTNAAREKRDSLQARVDKLASLVAGRVDQVVTWCDLNDEQRAIEKALKTLGISFSSLYGSQTIDEREELMTRWRDCETQAFVSKPSMYGAGVNLQQSHMMVFVGIGFRFHEIIQAVHRIHRFQQKHPCTVHFIYTEAEREVRRDFERKWSQHNEMVEKMTAIIREHGLTHAAMAHALKRSIGVERVEAHGDNWSMVNNDCVLEARRLATDSVGLIVTSVPFSTQYEYSPNYCYDEQTEVLTRRGWLRFGELQLSDQIATVNQSSLQIEWQTPSHVVWEPYVGPMLHFKNRRNFDLLVTPNHAMFADTRVGNRETGRKHRQFRRVLARDIANSYVMRKWRMMNAVQPGGGVLPDFIPIPPVAQPRKGPKPRVISKIAVRDFVELAGWYVSEGSCDPLTSSHPGRISISQCPDGNPENCRQIAALFDRIGLPARSEGRNIVAHNRALAAFLREQFGTGSFYKRIPEWMKELHPELLTILRDTMMKGDGTKRGFCYTSFSQRLRDDFQHICLMTGWRAAVHGMHVTIGRKQLFPEIRTRPEEIEYRGMIGCATVPNGTMVVRRNGMICVSGNSDFGHSDNNAHFFQQMDFLTPELLRALKPGRIAAIHVKDRIVPGGMTGLGMQTVYPFHAVCIDHFVRHGFAYMGMKTIVTDVVRENNQTYRLGWTEQCKDGSKMGVGMPEYLLLFRKPPTDTSRSYADEPVVKSKDKYSRARWQVDAHGFTRSSGNRPITAEDLSGLPHDAIFQTFRDFHLTNVYDFEHHVRLGEALDAKGMLPVTFMLLQPPSWSAEVWSDVARMLTLNSAQSAKGKELHLCPLPLDIVNRAITQWSNPGDLVLDPFAGIGTVPYCALKLGRKAVGFDLSAPYFFDACGYCKAAEREIAMPDLFAVLDRADGDKAA